MANITPIGIDGTTGQLRPLAGGDTLEGGGSTGAEALSSERQDMTGDVVLTGSSAVVQVIKPDQAGRVVALPAASDAALFALVNLSTRYSVSIEDDGVQIVLLGPSEMRLCVSDGAEGWAASGDTAIGGSSLTWGTLMVFGENSHAAGDFLQHGMSAFEGTGYVFSSSTLASWWGESIVTEPGAITAIEGQTSATAVTLKIYKNGAVADTVVCTVSGGRLTGEPGTTTFAEGDRIAVESDALNTSGVAIGLQILYTPAARADAHVRIGTFCLADAFANYPLWPSVPNSGTVSDDNEYQVQIPLPFTTTVRRIAWSSRLGDATTKLEVLKNYTLHETVTLTGAQGVLDLATPLSLDAGETVALRFPSSGGGTNPDDIMATLDADGLGQLYLWSGAAGASTGVFYLARERSTRAIGAISSSTYTTRQYVAKAGGARGLGWAKTNATGGALRVYKNGALDESVTIAAAFRGYVALTSGTHYEQGDYMDIQDNDSADIGSCNITVYVQ